VRDLSSSLTGYKNNSNAFGGLATVSGLLVVLFWGFFQQVMILNMRRR
jgi:hypothetical protein